MNGLFIVLALALVVSSLGVHELGHWAVMRRVGLPVQRVSLGAGPILWAHRRLVLRLFPVAVSLHFERESWRALQPQQRFAIALAGPAMNLVFAAALALVAVMERQEGLLQLAQLNLGLAVVNLIPCPPFDGWHAMCAASERWTNQAIPPRFEAVADRVGNAFIGALGAFVLLQLASAGGAYFG